MSNVSEHIRLIEECLTSSDARTETGDWRAASWSRCVGKYRLDPTKPRLVEVSNQELKLQNEVFDADLSFAEAELENAVLIVREGGYSAHIANRNGTVIAERRIGDTDLSCDSDRVGAVWTEPIGGTNGIGTSIETMKPTSVYLTDHFFSQFTAQACAAAPFFDPDGNIMGVVNLSTRNPALQESTHQVVFGVAQNVAGRLESRYFRERFRRQVVLALGGSATTPAMLAIDEDFRLVGATRAARAMFSLAEGAIAARSLWALFERSKQVSRPESLCQPNLWLRQLETGRSIEVEGHLPARAVSSAKGELARPKRARPRMQARRHALDDCVGQDSRMRRNVNVLRRLMGSGLHILLLGETGVGKDTLARALHDESDRADGPFVVFNCAAMPETLIDAELFGYSSGAFTGARREGNPGRIVEADGGTLFLDEIGDMPLLMQTRLLRFLETSEVTPLGGGKTHYVDAQILAATNQDLATQVREGRFRQDLFHRLTGAVIPIPPLREREDIDQLVHSILAQHADGRRLRFSEEALALLRGYDWPGNIRELSNVIRFAAHMVEGDTIGADEIEGSGYRFPSHGYRSDGRISATSLGPLGSSGTPGMASAASLGDKDGRPAAQGGMTSRTAVANAEKAALERAIAESRGNAVDCAMLLGVSRATLYRKLKRHGLSLS